MEMIYIFFCIILIIMAMGLIPSFVSEEKLHELITKMYLSEKTNLDKIYEELDNKNYLINDYFVSDCRSLTNCNSVYYFVEPVTVKFDIDSAYSGCQTYKEFHDVKTLTVFALSGDIECQVSNDEKSKSIFIFDDTHKLKFKIESENYDDD